MTLATIRRRLTRLEKLASRCTNAHAHAALLNQRPEPRAFAESLWPHVEFYDQQWEVIDSVVANNDTFVVAGNMLGKDFVAGFIALWFFLVHHPVRIVTTSVREDHLRVLWGEIGRFIQTSRIPLAVREGGPLVIHRREIKKVVAGKVCPVSYLLGCVSAQGEGMAGHHAAHTLAIIDEASGVSDSVYRFCDTWAMQTRHW